MRIHISHATTYTYDMPPTGVTQLLRLTPRDHEGQHVLSWRIDLSEDCLLHQHEDAFGNIIHSFTAEGPFDRLRVEVDGEVDTQDTGGLVNGAVERFPPQFSLRETLADADRRRDRRLRDGQRRPARNGDTLMLLHALLAALNREIAFDTDPTHAATTAARSIRAPARRLSGHHPYFCCGGADRSASRPATWAAISIAPTASLRRRPATPGRRPMSRIWAGSASIRPMAYASPTPMSGSRSGSTISAPRRYAARATAAVAKRCGGRTCGPGASANAELKAGALPKGCLASL